MSQMLKTLREGRGLSFDELSAAVGRSKTYLWGLESGKFTNPSTKVCTSLANFYDIPVSSLLDGTARGNAAEEIITWEALGERARVLTQRQLRIVEAVVDGLRGAPVAPREYR